MGTRDVMLRVGVIGAGIMGADHVRTLQRSVIGAAVTMIADVDRQRAEDAAHLAPDAITTRDAAEVIGSDDVDAVIIASHDATHADLAVAAIGAGKPVMCEKPLAPTVAECVRIVRAEDEALAAGCAPLISVGFMRRFDPGYLEMKAAIAAGACGVPLMVHCFHRGVSSVLGATTDSSITNTAVHEFDIVPWLLGRPIAAVSWHAPSVSTLAGGVQDPQLMLLHTAGGVLATVETLLNARYGYDIRCEVIGDRGSVALSHGGHIVIDSERTRARSYPADWRLRFADAYRLELQEWVDAILEGRPPALAGARDGTAAAIVADAVISSMKDGGRTVAVPACHGTCAPGLARNDV
jgi:myo-inositol 2-dehydrogenase/D-chiro-inositol 1-dehydrogenase